MHNISTTNRYLLRLQANRTTTSMRKRNKEKRMNEPLQSKESVDIDDVVLTSLIFEFSIISILVSLVLHSLIYVSLRNVEPVFSSFFYQLVMKFHLSSMQLLLWSFFHQLNWSMKHPKIKMIFVSDKTKH